MSDGLDRLAQAARNRGLKLVRSRIRTPKKRLFGKAALADASGKPLFGFDAKGRPSASPDAIERYLAGQMESEWKTSLKARRAR